MAWDGHEVELPIQSSGLPGIFGMWLDTEGLQPQFLGLKHAETILYCLTNFQLVINRQLQFPSASESRTVRQTVPEFRGLGSPVKDV